MSTDDRPKEGLNLSDDQVWHLVRSGAEVVRRAAQSELTPETERVPGLQQMTSDPSWLVFSTASVVLSILETRDDEPSQAIASLLRVLVDLLSEALDLSVWDSDKLLPMARRELLASLRDA